jgi:hypothetical protein
MSDISRTVWRKSSRSGGGNNCVEAAILGDQHLVRDSKHPDLGALVLDGVAWLAFIKRIKAGSYDQ